MSVTLHPLAGEKEAGEAEEMDCIRFTIVNEAPFPVYFFLESFLPAWRAPFLIAEKMLRPRESMPAETLAAFVERATLTLFVRDAAGLCFQKRTGGSKNHRHVRFCISRDDFNRATKNSPIRL